MRALLQRVWRVLLASAVMAVAIVAARAWIGPLDGGLGLLALEVAIGGAAYAIALWLLKVEAYHDVLAILRPMLQPTRRAPRS